MNSADQDKRIEAYLRGELVGIDKQLFEEELAHDAQLKADYLLQKELFEAVGNPKIDLMEAAIAAAGGRYTQQQKHAPKRGNRPVWWPYAVAAAVVVLIITGITIIWFSTSQPNPPSFAAYYEPFPAPGTYRGEGALQASDNLLLGLAHYEQAQYAEAIPYLTQEVEQDTTQAAMPRLLLGVSYLQTALWPNAVTALQPLTSDSTHTLYGPALWYHAYAAQQAGSPQQAQRLLQRLARRNDGPWTTKAKALLQQQ